MDELGLGDVICRRLQQQGQAVVKVRRGREYRQLGSAEYSIAADEPEHYNRLMESSASAGSRRRRVLHLWSFGDPTGPRSVCAGGWPAARGRRPARRSLRLARRRR